MGSDIGAALRLASGDHAVNDPSDGRYQPWTVSESPSPRRLRLPATVMASSATGMASADLTQRRSAISTANTPIAQTSLAIPCADQATGQTLRP